MAAGKVTGCSIDDAFRGKTIFVTGATGFLGKVFIYKMFKEFPDLEALYVLIRPKRNVNPRDRLNKELFGSACFGPLKKQVGDAEWQRLQNKCHPVTGDIMNDRLGIDDDTYRMLSQKVNYIFHLAATIDFQEKLNISVQMNVLGSLRVQALAHRCTQLHAFVHVSTCYVNWNRYGNQVHVKEVMYPLPFDPEGMCKRILSLHTMQIAAETKALLERYRYPNTYTFTKSMGEQILAKHKGSLPMVVVRPAIVGCSLEEPMPGWIDVLTAAGGIILTAGLGVLKELHCNESLVADIVPVDHVVRCMIKAGYKCALHHGRLSPTVASTAPSAKLMSPATQSSDAILANLKAIGQGPTAAAGAATPPAAATSLVLGPSPSQGHPLPLLQAGGGGSSGGSNDDGNQLGGVGASHGGGGVLPFIFQSATSGSMNPMYWRTLRLAVTAYWNANPHPKRVSACTPELIANDYEYMLKLGIRRRVPLMAMSIASRLPIIGNKERVAQVEKYTKALLRTIDMNFQFSPFTRYEWRFDNDNSRVLDEGVINDERMFQRFGTDVYAINWFNYAELYSYGIIHYVIKAPDGRGLPAVPPSGAEVFLKASL